MNKFILGSILAAISLMVIYGTSASNQVTSWVDGEDPASAQSDSGLNSNSDNGSDDSFIALSPTESDREPNIDMNDRTPLQKAGDIPKRQVGEVTSTPNFGTDSSANTGDDTGGVPITPNPPAAGAPGNTPSTPQTPAATTQPEEPIRALW
ncbi:MAG: hypothetical protein AAF572_01125 [Cyanobacteria bacterium P01_B01_bin.77]